MNSNREKAIEMRKKGMKLIEIAAILKVTYQRVDQYLGKNMRDFKSPKYREFNRHRRHRKGKGRYFECSLCA